jgi:hypothetical protein
MATISFIVLANLSLAFGIIFIVFDTTSYAST